MASVTRWVLELGPVAATMLKLTVLLAAAWGLEFMLRGRNPRWRVLLWRGAMAGAALLPLLAWAATFELALPVESPASTASMSNVPRAVVYGGPGADSPLAPYDSEAGHWSAIAPEPIVAPQFSGRPTPAPAFSVRAKAWLCARRADLPWAAWACGSALLGAWLAMGGLRLRRLVRSSAPAPERLQAGVGRVAMAMGCRSQVELRLSPELISPLLTGLRRPTILLPERMARPDFAKNLPAILAHELAHLRAGDLAWMLAARCMTALLWFHPLAWRMQSAHATACEEVSDAVAAGMLQSAEAYSSALARVALALAGAPLAPAVSIPMARGPEVTRRLRLLITGKLQASPLARRRVAVALVGGFALLVFLGGLRLVRAQAPVAQSSLSPASQTPTPQASASATNAAGAPDKIPAGARVLHFPKERSLGRLLTRDASIHHEVTDYYCWGTNKWGVRAESWAYLADARGDVVIPANTSVQLMVSTGGALDLSPLASLRPDDLDTLHCGKFTDDSLRCLAGLTGLKTLDMRDFSQEKTSAALPRLTERGLKSLEGLVNLECFDLPDGLTNQGLAAITRVKSLKGLYFGYHHSITNEGLAALAQLPNLEELDLNGEALTNDALAQLAQCSRLSYLALNSKTFGDPGMKYLKNIPSLRILNAGWCDALSDAGLAEIGQIKSLERLALYHCENITNNGLKALQPLQNLKMLDLNHAKRITDDGIANLRPLKSLEKLDASTTSYPQQTTDKTLEYVSELPNLKALNLVSSSLSPMSDAGVQYLSKLQNLEELSIGGKDITDKGVAVIARLPRLRMLFLFCLSQVTNAGVAELRNAKNLEDLNIDQANVTIDCLNPLNSLTGLIRLNLCFNEQPADGSAMDISGLVNLEELTLYNARDKDLACLDNLKNLREFQASVLQGSNKITDAGMRHLAGMTKLWRLTIGGPGVTDASLDVLNGMKNLTSLHLSGRFTDATLDRLARIDGLEILDVASTTPISDAAEQNFRGLRPSVRFGLKCNPKYFQPRPARRSKTTSASAKSSTGGSKTASAAVADSKHPRVGTKAPDFIVKTLDGAEFQLSGQRGKVVLLHFWATWCSPCVAGLPGMKTSEDHLREKFGDRVVVLDLAMDDATEDALWRSYVDKTKLSPSTQARVGMNSKLASDYGVFGAPDDFLIGPDGKVLLNRESPEGPGDTDAVIARALETK
jgi:beta-lactamase regulating signal transducer with metallopeptidase domain/thiol-disulfide isomerase/thioredoxin